MRTKTLICAAALVAAGAFSAMAQSNVYSLNVVGYVNVPTVGGGNFTMIANPLNNANNGLTNLFSVAQDGDSIFTWDASIQDLGGTIYTYSTFSHTWDNNRAFRPGEALFYLNSGNNATNTFVGDVVQGSYTNPVPIVGAGSFNGIASSVPIGGSFTNATVGIIPRDGDSVFTWDPPSQDLAPTIATYSTFSSSWDNTAININPGIGFFYLGSGPNQNPWVRNFTVP
jgi:hypothetical protein